MAKIAQPALNFVFKCSTIIFTIKQFPNYKPNPNPNHNPNPTVALREGEKPTIKLDYDLLK
jgi:hypothetical protein